jgi:PEP-CTERM motif
LFGPTGIAADGADLFVTNFSGGSNTIGEYTTAGATVNAALITGLDFPEDLAIAPTVPEPSTWAMMLIGFAVLGFVGFKQTRKSPRFA